MAVAQDRWNSRLGVVLAVAGSAVGLGNFLRFPGLVAEYGGGAFMIAYFISLLIVGVPLSWAEWAMGRYGGSKGFNSAPGIFNVLWRSPASKYVGILAVIIPVAIYMFYVNIESWCLAYAVNYASGNMDFETPEQSTDFFLEMIGVSKDGGAFGFGMGKVGFFLIIAIIINFTLIYRGISKGIELFCRVAMPALLVIAFIILIRVLTLGAPDPEKPENSVHNGLGYMWNPTRTVLEVQNAEGVYVETEQLVDQARIAALSAEIEASGSEERRVREKGLLELLLNPQLWLAAAGQIFFSLSVGFGVIINYSSYLKKDDDVVLSGLAAASTNEFCEVGLGGLITVPAAFAFLGVVGVAAGFGGSVGMGFVVLPKVFSLMPLGELFGFLFFFLLFLAAVTSSISMLQPGIAFLEETLRIDRKRSVALLGLITTIGTCFVAYFSKDTVAIDILDFWVGTFLIYILATIQIILFSWIFGLRLGLKEASKGAQIRIPRFFGFVMKFLCPAFLLIIFGAFMLGNVFGLSLFGLPGAISSKVTMLIPVNDGEVNPVAWMTVGLVAVVTLFFAIIVSTVKRYKEYHQNEEKTS